jgi:hypothetical protein
MVGEDIEGKKQGFAQANSMKEIGKRLLQSIGMSAPDDVSVGEAIEANNEFVARLERIRDRQRLTLEAT